MNRLSKMCGKFLKKNAFFGAGIFFSLLMLTLTGVTPAAYAATKHVNQPLSGSGAIVYTHVATSTNSVSDWTDLNNNVTNNNPFAVVYVTPNWAPYHVYDNHPIGVWYHNGKWSIFNQDLTAIPNHAAFNVYALPNASYGGISIHVATPSNSTGDFTDINNSASNGHPEAIVLVTPNWAPYHVYNNHPIGVWYHNGKWSIFNQDFKAIPNHAAFNVAIIEPNVFGSSTHIATATNSAGDFTDLNTSVTNGNPRAIVLFTPNWAPYSVYNNHNTGMWYHNGKWSIFNQDFKAIPNHAAFNVLAFEERYP